MREDERQKRLKPLVVAVERWAADRRVGRSDGWEVAREELRELFPGFLEVLLVPAVLSGNYSLLGPGFPARSAPAVSQALNALDANFFSRIERAGRVHLSPDWRRMLADAVYAWVALQLRGRGKRLVRSKGRSKKWDQETLIELLSIVYQSAGGKRGLYWAADGETVASHHANFLRAVWEALPTGLTKGTSSETFVRRARTEHFFARRFKDDAEHSVWLRQQKEKATKKHKQNKKLR